MLIVGLALLRGVLYAVLVPPWQAPDEPFHFEYVAELHNRYFPPANGQSVQGEIISSLARWDFWRYHNQTTPDPLPWGFSAMPLFQTIRYLDRSPTYYFLMLPFYSLFANQEIEVRLYILRLVNALLGAAAVAVAYFAARALFLKENYLAISVASFVALLPMFSFISGSLNNDNLANLFFALFIFFFVKSLMDGPSLLYSTLLIASAAMALLVKRSTVAVIPLLLLAPPFVLFRRGARGRRELAQRAGGVLAEVIVLSLLALRIWTSTALKAQIRNLLNFHEHLSEVSRRFADFLGPEGWPRIKSNSVYLFKGFWGHFGWQNIPLSNTLYLLFLVLSLLALLGLLLAFLLGKGPGRLLKREQKAVFLFLLSAVVITATAAFFRTVVLEFVPLQGRYVFPVLVPLGTLFVFGLHALFPKRFENLVTLALIGGLVIFDLVGWISYLLPAYYLV